MEPKEMRSYPYKEGVYSEESFGRDIVGERLPSLEEGRQYKFLCALETLAKEFLRRLSVIWSSPLSDYNLVVASNQFALPV